MGDKSYIVTRETTSRSYVVTRDGTSRSYVITRDSSSRSYVITRGLTTSGGGGGGGDMLAANNLSDLDDAPTARANLNLGTASTSNTSAFDPAGSAATAQAAAQSYADGLVVGLVDDRGNFDASGDVFPSSGGSGAAGAILKGDLWTVSVGGTLGTVPVTAGDVIRALVDTPGQTASNWAQTENNLGYVPQEASANLTALSALSGLADKLAYFTGVGAMALTAITTYGRTLLGLADKAALKTELDLTGTNSGDDAANSNYANDYRAANFVAGTDYAAASHDHNKGEIVTDYTLPVASSPPAPETPFNSGDYIHAIIPAGSTDAQTINMPSVVLDGDGNPGGYAGPFRVTNRSAQTATVDGTSLLSGHVMNLDWKSGGWIKTTTKNTDGAFALAGDLSTVGTTGDYDDLSNKPTLGSAAAADTGDFATSAQGATADTALQTGDALSSLDTTVTGAELNALKTKSDHLTVTQAVDLDQMEIDIAALSNGMVYSGDWDASSGSFPGGGTAGVGYFYNVSVAGTVDSVEFAIGDSIIATVINASTSTYAANWTKKDSTDAVQTVAGRVGNVVITASDLADFEATVTANSAVALNTAKLSANATNIGTAIFGATAKTTPVDADTVGLTDSAASNVLKKLTWANVKATLKTYFDTLYGTAAAVTANTAKVTNATHTADATGSTALTVVALNGTNLAALGTGILKNTTGTGVPSIAVAGTDYAASRTGVVRYIWVSAGAMIPRTTNGAAPGTVELATNDVMYDSLDFDTATEEGAGFWVNFGYQWDASTVKLLAYWTAASGSGTAKFDFAAQSYADSDALDQALGTEQGTTDTLITANDMHISPATAALTIADATVGEPVYFQVARDVATDTLGVDAQLLGVLIQFTESATEATAL